VETVTLACYLRDTDLVPIVQATFFGPNYRGSGAAPNQPLAVQFAGITRCELTGEPNHFSIDDVTFGTEASRVKVEIQEGRSLIAPTGLENSGGAPLLNGSPWPDNAELTISVVRGDSALPNKDVELALVAVDSAGQSVDAPFGHFHTGADGAEKPVGRLSSMRVNTGATGKVKVTYTGGLVSGPVVIQGKSDGVKEGADTILVGVPGLTQLLPSSTVGTVGATSIHPSSFWVTSEMWDALMEVADSFHTRYSRRVEYNDASLPLGGKFDLHSQWDTPDLLCVFTPAGGAPRNSPGGCHSSHRAGRDIDARTSDLSREQRNRLREYWQATPDQTVVSEGDHFHFRDRR
jgi:hypothetical protein